MTSVAPSPVSLTLPAVSPVRLLQTAELDGLLESEVLVGGEEDDDDGQVYVRQGPHGPSITIGHVTIEGRHSVQDEHNELGIWVRENEEEANVIPVRAMQQLPCWKPSVATVGGWCWDPSTMGRSVCRRTRRLEAVVEEDETGGSLVLTSSEPTRQVGADSCSAAIDEGVAMGAVESTQVSDRASGRDGTSSHNASEESLTEPSAGQEHGGSAPTSAGEEHGVSASPSPGEEHGVSASPSPGEEHGVSAPTSAGEEHGVSAPTSAGEEHGVSAAPSHTNDRLQPSAAVQKINPAVKSLRNASSRKNAKLPSVASVETASANRYVSKQTSSRLPAAQTESRGERSDKKNLNTCGGNLLRSNKNHAKDPRTNSATRAAVMKNGSVAASSDRIGSKKSIIPSKLALPGQTKNASRMDLNGEITSRKMDSCRSESQSDKQLVTKRAPTTSLRKQASKIHPSNSSLDITPTGSSRLKGRTSSCNMGPVSGDISPAGCHKDDVNQSHKQKYVSGQSSLSKIKTIKRSGVNKARAPPAIKAETKSLSLPKRGVLPSTVGSLREDVSDPADAKLVVVPSSDQLAGSSAVSLKDVQSSCSSLQRSAVSDECCSVVSSVAGGRCRVQGFRHLADNALSGVTCSPNSSAASGAVMPASSVLLADEELPSSVQTVPAPSASTDSDPTTGATTNTIHVPCPVTDSVSSVERREIVALESTCLGLSAVHGYRLTEVVTDAVLNEGRISSPAHSVSDGQIVSLHARSMVTADNDSVNLPETTENFLEPSGVSSDGQLDDALEEVQRLQMVLLSVRCELQEERVQHQRVRQCARRSTDRLLEADVQMSRCRSQLSSAEQQLAMMRVSVQQLQIQLTQSRAAESQLAQNLDKSVAAQKNLVHQIQENACDSRELLEFVQLEKNALVEALKEAESENKGVRSVAAVKDDLIKENKQRCCHLLRLAEHRAREIISLRSELRETRCSARELLLQQGDGVNYTSAALRQLTRRLKELVLHPNGPPSQSVSPPPPRRTVSMTTVSLETLCQESTRRSSTGVLQESAADQRPLQQLPGQESSSFLQQHVDLVQEAGMLTDQVRALDCLLAQLTDVIPTTSNNCSNTRSCQLPEQRQNGTKNYTTPPEPPHHP